MSDRLRKDTSYDLPPARNARKWQLAKEEAARQGRGGDIREIINIYNLMAMLPTYKSDARVQKQGCQGSSPRPANLCVKAGAHKYISRERKGERWVYTYPDAGGPTAGKTAKNPPEETQASAAAPKDDGKAKESPQPEIAKQLFSKPWTGQNVHENISKARRAFGIDIAVGYGKEAALHAPAAMGAAKALCGLHLVFDIEQGIVDKLRVRVDAISDRMTNARYDQYASTIELDDQRGRQSLFHEFGHFLDHYIGSKAEKESVDGGGAKRRGSLYATHNSHLDAKLARDAKVFIDAVKETPDYKSWQEHPNGEYLCQPTEIFARYFDQWVNTRLKEKGHNPEDYGSDHARNFKTPARGLFSEKSFATVRPLFNAVAKGLTKSILRACARMQKVKNLVGGNTGAWRYAEKEAARRGKPNAYARAIYARIASKSGDNAQPQTSSGKPISPAASDAYAAPQRIFRQQGLRGARGLAECLHDSCEGYTPQDHLDAAEYHSQRQHDGSDGDKFASRVASWSHQMAAEIAKSRRLPLNITKSQSHKYVSREWNHDRWDYTYAQDAGSGHGASAAATSSAIDADMRDVEHPALNVQQKEAVAFYQSDSFVAFNDSLRDPEGTAEMLGGRGAKAVATMLEDGKVLSQAINLSHTKAPIRIYRGMSLPPTAIRVGGTIGDKGFVSTTTDVKVAKQFAAPDEPLQNRIPVLITTVLPKGASALAVAKHVEGADGGEGEHELLLPTGSAFAIKSVRVVDGVHHVEAEFVPHSKANKRASDVPPQAATVLAERRTGGRRSSKKLNGSAGNLPALSIDKIQNAFNPDASDEDRKAAHRNNVAALSSAHPNASSQEHADLARAHLRAAKAAQKKAAAGDSFMLDVQQKHTSAYRAHRRLAESRSNKKDAVKRSHQMVAGFDDETAKSMAERHALQARSMEQTIRRQTRPRLSLHKAASHAYTSRERGSDGSWRYHYAGDGHEGIGKTQSGKAVPHPADGEYRNHMPGDTKFANYSKQDHADAAAMHADAAKKMGQQADDTQHAYATRHNNTSVKETTQQHAAGYAQAHAATDARTMAQAHVDAAATHHRLGAVAKSAKVTPAQSMAFRRKLAAVQKSVRDVIARCDAALLPTVFQSQPAHSDIVKRRAQVAPTEKHQQPKGIFMDACKKSGGVGSRGGIAIGKTRTGKVIYQSRDHSPAMKRNGAITDAQQTGNAQHVKAANPKFTTADHADAAAVHDQHAERARQTAKRISADSHNTNGPEYKQQMRTAAIHSALSAAHASHASADEQDKALGHASVSAKPKYGASRKSFAIATNPFAAAYGALSKAAPKYIKREKVGDHWKYTYSDGGGATMSHTHAELAALADHHSAQAKKFSRKSSQQYMMGNNIKGAASSQITDYHRNKAKMFGALSSHAKQANSSPNKPFSAKSKGAAFTMQKSMTDPLSDVTIDAVYSPMSFARISDETGAEIKTDSGSIDELAALIGDMAGYNTGAYIGSVSPAQRDKTTETPGDEPPKVMDDPNVCIAGNGTTEVPATQVVTKSLPPTGVQDIYSSHGFMTMSDSAQFQNSRYALPGMPTFVQPDALEGDDRFAVIAR